LQQEVMTPALRKTIQNESYQQKNAKQNTSP